MFLWLFLLVFDYCFLSTSQEIGWEEHLWNDLFCVEWDQGHIKASVGPGAVRNMRPLKTYNST